MLPDTADARRERNQISPLPAATTSRSAERKRERKCILNSVRKERNNRQRVGKYFAFRAYFHDEVKVTLLYTHRA